MGPAGAAGALVAGLLVAGAAGALVAGALTAGALTAGALVAGWLGSPGHCANLMEPAFSEMGVAFGVNPRDQRGVYWAMEFGRPL